MSNLIRSKYSLHVAIDSPVRQSLRVTESLPLFLSLVDSFLFVGSGSFASNMSSVIPTFAVPPGVQFPVSAVPTHPIVPHHLAHQFLQPTPIPNAPLQPSQLPQPQPVSGDLTDLLSSPTSSISSGASSPVPTSSQSNANDEAVGKSSSISQPVSTAVSSSTATFSNTPTTQPSDTLDPATDATLTSVLAASTTATPESSQGTSQTLSSSSTLTRQPLFLIGILLGSMAAIACLATLIAWLIRTRTHIRRRHQELAADIPWVQPSSDHPGLEEGRLGEARFIGRPVSRRPFWAALSEHDVGEPKRSKSYFNDRGQIYAPYLGSGSSADHQGGGDATVTYPLPVHHGSYQSTLSYGETSHDGHEGAPTLGPLQIFNLMPGDFSVEPSPAPSTRSSVNLSGDLGTPRGDDFISQPRFLGLENKGLRVPWGSTPQQPILSDQINLLDSEKPKTATAANTGVGEKDGWTASLKTNLVNAFNAVAMNLSSSGLNNREGGETFTPRPSRQAATHRSIRIRSGRFPGPLSLPPSQSESGVATSPVWTLQDRGDGSGTVHFPGIDVYEGDPDTGATVTRSSDELSSPWDAPFVATMKPKEAFLSSRPLRQSSGSGRGSTGTTRTGIGTGSGSGFKRRSSSVYSISSATSFVDPAIRRGASSATSLVDPTIRHGANGGRTRPVLPRLSRQSTMTVDSLESSGESAAWRARPGANFRMGSSSGFSLSSYYLDDGDSVRSSEGERKRHVRKVA